METKRKALGKGLEQLFSNEVINFENFEKNTVAEAEKKSSVGEIKISEVRSNPYQPRKTFNEETLNELAASIKEHGVIEPIIVKKAIKGYELVAGERRLKAAKISFSHKQHVHRQEVNLQSVKVNQNGTVKRIDVCTSCIRAGKVQRAV